MRHFIWPSFLNEGIVGFVPCTDYVASIQLHHFLKANGKDVCRLGTDVCDIKQFLRNFSTIHRVLDTLSQYTLLTCMNKYMNS